MLHAFTPTATTEHPDTCKLYTLVRLAWLDNWTKFERSVWKKVKCWTSLSSVWSMPVIWHFAKRSCYRNLNDITFWNSMATFNGNISLLDKLLLLLEWTAAIKDNIIKGKESTYKTHQHLQSCLTTIIDFAWLQDQWNAHEASANYGVTRSYRCLRGWGEHSSSYNQACILLSIN